MKSDKVHSFSWLAYTVLIWSYNGLVMAHPVALQSFVFKPQIAYSHKPNNLAPRSGQTLALYIYFKNLMLCVQSLLFSFLFPPVLLRVVISHLNSRREGVRPSHQFTLLCLFSDWSPTSSDSSIHPVLSGMF